MICDKYMKFNFQGSQTNFSTGIDQHSFLYMLSLVAFALQPSSQVILTKTEWPTKPKYSLSGHLQKKF